jgi:hypothetical protein
MNGPKSGGTKNPVKPSRLKNFKARWPAWVTLFIVALLYEALPKIFYWGPRGLMISLVTVLTLPMIVSHWNNNLRIIRILTLSVNILVTFYIIMSVSRLILAALEGQIGPKHLLLSALILWGTNILAFALWYWSLDAGGPHKRELKEFNGITAFLFPQKQMSLMGASDMPGFIKNWAPHFIDYLFLAFNTSTAFSPTDTPVLNKWAKCMSMIQALISLTIIMVLAARAINILNNSSSYFVS